MYNTYTTIPGLHFRKKIGTPYHFSGAVKPSFTLAFYMTKVDEYIIPMFAEG